MFSGLDLTKSRQYRRLSVPQLAKMLGLARAELLEMERGERAFLPSVSRFIREAVSDRQKNEVMRKAGISATKRRQAAKKAPPKPRAPHKFTASSELIRRTVEIGGFYDWQVQQFLGATDRQFRSWQDGTRNMPAATFKRMSKYFELLLERRYTDNIPPLSSESIARSAWRELAYIKHELNYTYTDIHVITGATIPRIKECLDNRARELPRKAHERLMEWCREYEASHGEYPAVPG